MTRAVRLITIALLICTAATLRAPRAFAGAYTVWSCRGPSGESVATGAWERLGRAGTDGCAGGGALAARAGSGYRIEAPIVGYRVWRSALVGWGGFAALVEEPFTTPVDALGTRGDASHPLAAANLVERSDVALRSLAIVAGCRWVCPGAELRLYRSAVDVADTIPPTAAGALRVGDDGTAAITAADVGGGLRSARLSLDGVPVASAPADCAEPYTRVAPCPASATFSFTFAAGPGEHTLSVAATDAAGNTATLDARTLNVESSSSLQRGPVQAASPSAPTSAAPAPRLVPRRLTVAKTRFAVGGRASISGRVAPAAAGATVVVERRWYGARGGAWKRVGTLRTNGRGRFVMPLPEVAQQLRFRLPGAARARVVDVVSRLALTVRARPATLRNGKSIVLSGKLAGAGPAARGEPIDIQAMISGRWQTVATVRASASGSFRWRYRFRNTRLEAIYSFRARVADTSRRWPWPTIGSSRVRVHVLP